jgi:hypothetical protein
LHRLRETDNWQPIPTTLRAISRTVNAAPGPDLAQLSARYQLAVSPTALRRLSESLGLSASSLFRLGIGWSIRHNAWSFPMTDGHGQILGIRLRRPNGFKFSVTGGHEGLFVPQREYQNIGAVFSACRLLICEGPTDAAALLDMGFDNVLGRPSCSGGVKLLVRLAQKTRPDEVVIVADADDPGRLGAAHLSSALAIHVPLVRVIVPPDGIKDARAWRKSGATKQDVEQVVQMTPARQLLFRAINREQKG